MLRRKPFALPHAEQLPPLIALLDGAAAVAPADEDGFLEAVVAHRLIGSAVEALDSGRLALADRQARVLRDAEAVAALRSSLLRAELVAIGPPLTAATGAAPIVLKGPAIADRFYPDRRLRSFADLDLLVPRRRLADAVGALARLGYEERVELREGFGATHGHDVHMARPLGRQSADVELHWRLGDDPLGEALSHESLAEHAAGAGPALYPTPSDQLLVCAMHLLSDRLKRLAWIEDLRRVSVTLDEASWTRAFTRARGLGLLWVLNRALDYTAHHLGYDRERPLPPGEPPPWGPLRAVEELDLRASVHLGRLAAMPWRRRPGYVKDVLIPSGAGLRGTVGTDGAGSVRMAARHLSRTLRGLTPRR